MVDSSMFEAYASERKKETELREAKKNGGNFQKQFEETQWAVCEKGIPTIVRVVGGPIDKNIDPTWARTVSIAMITGDDGKKFKVCRNDADKDYIINKIIKAVTKATWDNEGNKSIPCQTEHPEVYNIIMKNGLPPTDPRYKMEKGWKGSEVIVFNCIDRSQMAWHRQNKHTALICKSINKNGFADDGITSYKTRDTLDKLLATYGSWEQFDLGIIRNGTMESPYSVYNVSRNPEFVDDRYASLISNEPLTEEEDSWERYDLEKRYRPTSATKLYNRLKATIAKIDLALGTHFLEELEAQSKKELEEWEKNKPQEEAKPVAKEEPKVEESFYDEEEEPIAPPKPVVRRGASASAQEEWKKFPYADAIPSHLRPMIKKAYQLEDGAWTADWDSSIDTAICDCQCQSPLECTTCPNCGASFE